MSFDHLSSLESQQTTVRRYEDSEYQDDPEFNTFSEELSSKLFTLTSNIGRLSQQINLLGTKRDTPRARERVRDLLEEAREGFKEAGDGIKQLTAWENLNASQRYTQQKLSREFQASGIEFQTIQRQALEKQRESANHAKAVVASGEASASQHTAELSSDRQQQEHEQARLVSPSEVDFQESLIIERESEIRNIEQSVGELNELFRDVAHIVREQGEQLDHIENNVTNTVEDTRQADLELRSANKYQKQARGRMCCLLLILVVILVIIVLAVSLG